MTHHGHSVECGLTIEKDVVSILEVTFYDHAVVEVFLDLVSLIVHFDEVDDVVVFLLVL